MKSTTATTIHIAMLGMIMTISLACSSASSRTSPEDLSTQASTNNEFAIDLYHQLANGDGNIVFCPPAVSTAMAMTYAGARGRTEKEIAQVMHFTLPLEKLHPAMGELNRRLIKSGSQNGNELRMANGIWVERDLDLTKSFLDTMSDAYGLKIMKVDFTNSPEQARDEINQWIGKHTKNKIQNPLGPGSISSQDRMVLAGAVYFNGIWKHKFKKEDTEQRSFFLADGEKIEVPMMMQEEKFRMGFEDGLQILEMPYRGENVSMIILLPGQSGDAESEYLQDCSNAFFKSLSLTTEQVKQGMLPENYNERFDEFCRLGLPLKEHERTLSSKALDQWLTDLEMVDAEVSLPKFNFSIKVDISDELDKMGMEPVFNGNADFSGMFTDTTLFPQKAIQETIIEVDEDGTRAISSFFMVFTLAGKPSFIADHPFIFLIRDNETGSILFMGRVMDPRG